MPKYRMTLDALEEPYTLPEPAAPEDDVEYPTLGILDSGIEPTDAIGPWIIEERWSPYPSAEQDHGHGTFVAGVAEYGDQPEHERWVDGDRIRLFDANVFPNENAVGQVFESEVVTNIEEALD